MVASSRCSTVKHGVARCRGRENGLLSPPLSILSSLSHFISLSLPLPLFPSSVVKSNFFLKKTYFTLCISTMQQSFYGSCSQFWVYFTMIFFSGGCEERLILWAFFTNLSLETIYLSPKLREKWPYL